MAMGWGGRLKRMLKDRRASYREITSNSRQALSGLSPHPGVHSFPFFHF